MQATDYEEIVRPATDPVGEIADGRKPENGNRRFTDWSAEGAPRSASSLDLGTRPTGSEVYNVRFFSLLASDALVLLALTLAAWLLSDTVRALLIDGLAPSSIPTERHVGFIMIGMPVLMLTVMSYNAGHYTRFKPIWLETKEFLKISGYTIAGVSILLFVVDAHFSRLWFLSFWSLSVVVVPISRLITKHWLIRHGKWFRPVVVFGTGLNARRSADAIRSDRMLGLEVVAFVRTASDSDDGVVHVPREQMVELDEWVPALGAGLQRQHFLFAPDTTTEFERNKLLLNQLSSRSKSITISPPFYGLPLDGAEIVNIPKSDAVLLRLQNNLAKRPAVWLKRLFDITVASIALLLLAPLLLTLIVLIKRDGGPAFFRQRRIGKDGVAFDCWKLRSMRVDGDDLLRQHLALSACARREWDADQKLRDDPRVTRVGRLIRASSVDELPQLWNVLRGDMSLVGPRPIVLDERERYGQLLSYYLNQSPGITGLWQISGRNDTGYAKRVDLDVWYSRNWSFWLDLVILARTLPVVLGRRGAY